MLPKNERLKDRYLFNLTFKKKQRINSEFLVLYYLKGRKDINNFPRIAVAVGLNVDKKSTKRNFIKRRIFEAYSLIKKKIQLVYSSKSPLLGFSVLILVAKPNIKDATFVQIRNSVENLLFKLIKPQRFVSSFNQKEVKGIK